MPEDFLIFSSDYPIPTAIAGESKAKLIACSSSGRVSKGCYVRRDTVVWCTDDRETDILELGVIPLPGKFNVQNVMAAVAAASLVGVPAPTIRDAVKTFRGLPHRLEIVGTFKGITFYDDSIATVPEAALAALDALGSGVETLILGGHERHLNFTEFGKMF